MSAAKFKELQNTALELLSKGCPAEAKPYLDQLMTEDPDNINGWELYDFYLAQAYNVYRDTEDNLIDKKTRLEEQIKAFTRMTELNPEDRYDVFIEAEYMGGIWYCLARVYADYCTDYSYDPGHFLAAIAALNRGIAVTRSKGDDPSFILREQPLYVKDCLNAMTENRFGTASVNHYDHILPGASQMLLEFIDERFNCPDNDPENYYIVEQALSELKAEILMDKGRYAEAILSLNVALTIEQKEAKEAIENSDNADEREEIAERNQFNISDIEQKIYQCRTAMKE